MVSPPMTTPMLRIQLRIASPPIGLRQESYFARKIVSQRKLASMPGCSAARTVRRLTYPSAAQGHPHRPSARRGVSAHLLARVAWARRLAALADAEWSVLRIVGISRSGRVERFSRGKGGGRRLGHDLGGATILAFHRIWARAQQPHAATFQRLIHCPPEVVRHPHVEACRRLARGVLQDDLRGFQLGALVARVLHQVDDLLKRGRCPALELGAEVKFGGIDVVLGGLHGHIVPRRQGGRVSPPRVAGFCPGASLRTVPDAG